MSLATLHTDAHRRLEAARSYPASLAMRAATAIAVRIFKADSETVAAMKVWHADALKSAAAVPAPAAFTEAGRIPAFALTGIATRKPLLLIGALVGFAALPVFLFLKLF